MASRNVDTEIDAEPECNQVTLNEDDAEADLTTFTKSRAQQETAVNRDDVVTNQTHTAKNDNDYLPYLKHFPEHLKEDYIDILIINAEDDSEGAKKLKERIATGVTFHQGLKPKVTLLSDVYTEHSFEQLDKAYSRSHFIFMYVTNNFCADSFKLTQSYQSLERALINKDSKAVIPVYSSPKDWINGKLPMMLNHHDINDFDGTLNTKVTDILENKSYPISNKRYNLHRERAEYLKKNLPEFMSREKYFQSKLLHERSSVSDSGSKPNEEFQSTSVENENNTKIYAEIHQQMGQCSVSSEKTYVKNVDD